MSFTDELYTRMKNGETPQDIKASLLDAIASAQDRYNQEKAKEIAATATFNSKVNDMVALINALFDFLKKHYNQVFPDGSSFDDISADEVHELATEIIKELDKIDDVEVKPVGKHGVEVKTSAHGTSAGDRSIWDEWLKALENF